MNLTRKQLARADALEQARLVLAARTPITSGAVDALDLVHVASWILDGRDPWGCGVEVVAHNGLVIPIPEQEGTAA